MSQLEVEVTRVNLYDIKIGDKVHKGFRKTGEWEGMVKFQSPAGVLVLAASEVGFGDIFQTMFGGPVDASTETLVVMRISDALRPAPSKETNGDDK